MITAIPLGAGLYNTLRYCRWSTAACVAVGSIQAACAAEHATFQWLLLTRWRNRRLQETAKAWVMLTNLVVCMLLAMLVR